MHQFIWNLSSFVYKKLGPKNSWRVAMNPVSKFFIFLKIKAFGGKKIIVKTKYEFLIQISIDEFLTGGYLHIGEINPFETKAQSAAEQVTLFLFTHPITVIGPV